MLKFYLALLLSLKVINVQTVESDTDTSESSTNILPLTMILSNIGCVTPTAIDNVEYLNHNQSLGALTTFSNFRHQGHQIFFCAAHTVSGTASMASTSQTPQLPVDYQYCNYSVIFNYSNILKCTHEPKYLIEPVLVETATGMREVPCTENTSGQLFRFIYKLCLTTKPIINGRAFDITEIIKTLTNQTEFEAFRFCYEPQTGTLLRTEHRIMSARLLEEDALQNERDISYQPMLDAKNFFNRDWFALKEFHDEVDKHSNDTQTDTSTDDQEEMQTNTPIDPRETRGWTRIITRRYILQKLVPPEDLAFALWKKPTYDFLNNKFMRSDLVNLWNHISALIRADAMQKNREYLIHTSAYRRPSQTDITNIHFPEIWQKKIFFQFYHPTEPHETGYYGIAIIMNQYFDDDDVSDPLGIPCVNLCRGFFTRQFPNVGHSIRCCTLIGVDTADHVKVDGDLSAVFLRS